MNKIISAVEFWVGRQATSNIILGLMYTLRITTDNLSKLLTDCCQTIDGHNKR